MIRIADGHRRIPANDNSLWSWHGTCAACHADMGPVRDARLCHPCNDAWLAGLRGLNGEPVDTDVSDHLRRIGIVGFYKQVPCRLVVTDPESGNA